MEGNMIDITPSDWTEEKKTIIKVIGVGGGGCNAVDYMYRQNIQGCAFIVCNTDAQALNDCEVPIKIQLGTGLGAGCNPTEGRNAALNSQEEIAEKGGFVVEDLADKVFEEKPDLRVAFQEQMEKYDMR